MNHEEASELLPALALNAVEGDERSAAEEHVAGCPHCQSELDWLIDVAGAVGTTVEPLPDDLWSKISSRLYEDRGQHETPSMPLAKEVGIVAPAHRQRPSRRPRAQLMPIVVGVAAVIVAVLTFQIVRADEHASSLQRALNASARNEVAAALATPGRVLVSLNGASHERLAQFVMLPDGRGYLVSSKLPTLDAGETYQLWGVIDGKSISIGLMGRSPSSIAFTVSGPPQPSELAVTVEPSGGTATPTSPILAAGLT